MMQRHSHCHTVANGNLKRRMQCTHTAVNCLLNVGEYCIGKPLSYAVCRY